jgi:hypothetical protein
MSKYVYGDEWAALDAQIRELNEQIHVINSEQRRLIAKRHELLWRQRKLGEATR